MTKLGYLQEATMNLRKIDGITLVGCVYCCETYTGDKTDFVTCTFLDSYLSALLH